MARSRNIKPGFFTNDELAECGPLGMLLFEGLWVIADREGRLEDRPKRIKAQVLPYFDADVDDLLNQLADRGFVQRYEVAGQRYLHITKFLDHQNPHIKEAPSTIPAPCSPCTSTEKAGAGPLEDHATDPQSTHEINDIDQHQTSTVLSRLIPDSSLLIPDSGLPSTPPTPRKRGGVRVVYPPEFEEFWSEVVRKEPSKAKALDCWRRALKRSTPEEPVTPEIILAGLRKFIPAWQVMEPDKVPHITTWLNQDRWTATPVMPRVRLVTGPVQGDEAMAAWLKVAEEVQHPGSAFPDGKIPKRIWRAAQAVGGIEAIDVTNGYQRHDFMVAYRELGVAP